MSFPKLPYSSVLIDSSYSQLRFAMSQCFTNNGADHTYWKNKLRELWTKDWNPNPVLPCLSVRTGFDLYLSVKNFPKGSEVIMSAINIPDMVRIIHHHGLRVVPVDICVDTLEPKVDLLERLISSKTVAVVIAHLYGRWIHMDPVIRICQKYSIPVIEDCAESFCGFSELGHVDSDLVMFSFGVIKFCTSFGGAIAKVRDYSIYKSMTELYALYPQQTGAMYMKKVLKYVVLYSFLQVPPFPQMVQLSREMGLDLKDTFVSYTRGFPDDLISGIRHQPSFALLAVMGARQCAFDQASFDVQRIKAEYFLANLPVGMEAVGVNVKRNNFWLFPVLMNKPDAGLKQLSAFGVDAYRGATQLGLIQPDSLYTNEKCSRSSGERVLSDELFPHEAKYLMDHIVYMPVNKFVPYRGLNQMIRACRAAMELQTKSCKGPYEDQNLMLRAKL